MENFQDDCIDFRRDLLNSESKINDFAPLITKVSKALKQFHNYSSRAQSSIATLSSEMIQLPEGIKNVSSETSQPEYSEHAGDAVENIIAGLKSLGTISTSLQKFCEDFEQNVIAPTNDLSEDLKVLDDQKKKYEKSQQNFETSFKKALQNPQKRADDATKESNQLRVEYEMKRFDYYKELYDTRRMTNYQVSTLVSGLLKTFKDLHEGMGSTISDIQESITSLDKFREEEAKKQYDVNKVDVGKRTEFEEKVNKNELMTKLGSGDKMEGWLLKKSSGVKKVVNKRWFVLENGKFYHYSSNLERQPSVPCENLVIKREPETALNFCFEVSVQGTKDVFFLQAPDKETKMAWVNALRKAKDESKGGSVLEYRDIYTIQNPSPGEPEQRSPNSPPVASVSPSPPLPPPKRKMNAEQNDDAPPRPPPKKAVRVKAKPPRPAPKAEPKPPNEKKRTKQFGFGRRNRGATTRETVTRADIDPIFGITLEKALEGNAVLPRVIQDCITYLIKTNAVLEMGIFRLSGSQTQIMELKEKYNKRTHVDLDSVRDIHVVAGLLKLYLRELPEPIVEGGIQNVIEGIIDNMEEGPERTELIKQQLRRLPLVNRATLQWMLGLLAQVVKNEEKNKMGFNNVAIVFCPTLQFSGKLFKDLLYHEGEYKEQ